jgi:thiopeptide-type bacteriocin biosynthesis protein
MTLWLSAHLNFNGILLGDDGDRVVLNVVQPSLARLRADRAVDAFFFVRYDEGGAHIRFRLRAPQAHKDEVKDAVARHLDELCRPEHVKWSWRRYEPEWQRYGGAVGIPIAEAFFETSSNFALAALAGGRLRTDRSARLSTALLSCVVLHLIFSNNDARASTRALERFVAGLGSVASAPPSFESAALSECVDARLQGAQPYVAECRRRLTAGESLSPALDEYVKGARDAYAALLAAKPPQAETHAGYSLVPLVRGSYCHMTNNRLGLLRQEEILLAQLAARTLEEPSEIP